ncbi:unnamed protein product [Somion occarium]|uniref:Vacuolar sorting protein Vps3844 C-terminal domain-containing protein n=1 Tax=Somion occarium TaxID=3059160 RepID=A0ABP1DGE6_9APHY
MKQALSLLIFSLYGLLASATDEANQLLAQYLGLERFQWLQGEGLTENLEAYTQSEGGFVGKGLDNAVVLSISEEEIPDIVPPELTRTLSVDVAPLTLLPQYVQQAESIYTEVSRSPSLSHTYSPSSQPEKPQRLLDIFSLPATAESATFLADLSSLVDFTNDLDDSDSHFGAFDLSRSLNNLTKSVGRDSEAYNMATNVIKATLSKAISEPNLRLVLFSVPKSQLLPRRATGHSRSKRQQPPQSPFPPPLPHPAEPIGAISTCYNSEATCTNATSSCSGHGSCISASKAGKTCFVCACEVTTIETGKGKGTNAKKTIRWAGDKCERKDVSGDFVLIVGTVVGLIVMIVGSVALLAGVGSVELPSVLTGGVVAGSKRD